MKIVMVTDFYPPHIGGVERAVADLAAGLNARGHRVAVATLWRDGLPRRACDGGVDVYRLSGAAQAVPLLYADPGRQHHPPFCDPLLARRLAALIDVEQPDIVHGHTWMMLSALSRRRRVATVATFHDYSLLCPKKTLLYHDRQPCQWHLSRHCLSCATRAYGFLKSAPTIAGLSASRGMFRGVDRLIAVSTSVAAAHVRDGLVAPSAITTIPNFVGGAFLRADPGPPLPDLPADYILFVGMLSAHKGFATLLRAYESMNTAVPLVVIGAARSAVPGQVPPGVIVRPPAAQGDIVRAMDHCRFVVCPALWPEPFGLVAIEAMARGKAVVATASGGLADIVDHERTGLLVAPGDATALARAMRRLVVRPDLARTMGEHGRERCQQRFSQAVVLSRVMDVYEDAIQRVRARGVAGRNE